MSTDTRRLLHFIPVSNNTQNQIQLDKLYWQQQRVIFQIRINYKAAPLKLAPVKSGGISVARISYKMFLAPRIL